MTRSGHREDRKRKVDANDSRRTQKRKRHTETLSLGRSVKVIRSDQPPINRPQPTAINGVIPPNSKSAAHNGLQSKNQFDARSPKDSLSTKSFSTLSARWSDTDNRSRRVYTKGLSQIMTDEIRIHVSTTPKTSRHWLKDMGYGWEKHSDKPWSIFCSAIISFYFILASFKRFFVETDVMPEHWFSSFCSIYNRVPVSRALIQKSHTEIARQCISTSISNNCVQAELHEVIKYNKWL